MSRHKTVPTGYYRLETTPVGHRIIKYDIAANEESRYDIIEMEGYVNCTCPAGSRPSCRHRDMLPDMLERVDTQWFWEYPGGIWHDLTGYEAGKVTLEKFAKGALFDDDILAEAQGMAQPNPTLTACPSCGWVKAECICEQALIEGAVAASNRDDENSEVEPLEDVEPTEEEIAESLGAATTAAEKDAEAAVPPTVKAPAGEGSKPPASSLKPSPTIPGFVRRI